jgi:hypothetical protein
MNPRYISKAAVTRPDDTTAYTALDVLGGTSAGNSVIEFTNIAPSGGGSIVLLYASLRVDVGTVPAGYGQMRLHLYDSAPAAIADNAAYNLPSGDRAKYLGYLTLGTPIDLGDTLFSEDDFLRKQIVATSSSIFAIAQTLSAFTPTASTVKNWELRAAEV